MNRKRIPILLSLCMALLAAGGLQATQARNTQTLPPREPISVSKEVVEAWKQGQITTGDMATALMAHFRAQREKDEYMLNLFADLEKGNINITALVVHVKEMARGRVGTMLHRDCSDFAGGVLIGCTLAGGPDETCIQAADAFYCLCLGGIYSEGGWCAIM